MPHTVEEIAHAIGGRVRGNPALALRGVNSLALAGPEELSFISSAKHFKEGELSRAGCLIAPEDFSASTKTVITSPAPKAAFVKAMWLFNPTRYAATGVHPSAVVDPSAALGAEVSVGPLVTIGKEATIGDRVALGSGVVIGERARIGPDTVLYPNVTLYHGVILGARVIVHAGTIIGADGFGFVFDEGRHVKVPQLGTVIIEDDVEIGANCTIDRATFGATLIRRGTKTDNLVHVAHNVTVGEHSLLIAQVGIAGSSKIGSYVTLAGQVGVSDNASIGDHVTVAGKSVVASGQRIESHQTVWGIPARPIEETKRQLATLFMLPKFLERLRKLEARLNNLEKTPKPSQKSPKKRSNVSL